MMARLILSVFILLASCTLSPAVASAAALPLTIYVSPTGDDRWSGRLAEPNADRTDGPVATPAGGRDALRRARKTDPAAIGDVTINFRAGTYFLTEPLELTPTDGGTDNSAVTYQGEAGVLFSGGVRITGWKVAPDGRWTVTLPQVKAGAWNFAQLYVNKQRRMRPRLPKQGYHHIAGRVPSPAANNPNAGDRRDDRFRYAAEHINPAWRNRGDIEVITFHPWFTSMLRIAEVEAASRLVTFTGPTRSSAAWGQLTPGMRYLVENVAEALCDPGEWYLDRPTGVLTYIPMPGETLETAEVIAPRLEQLVRVAGVSAAKVPATPGAEVKKLTFRHIGFCHTHWATPIDGSSISQAAITVPAALQATYAADLSVDRCTFAQLAGYAVEIGVGCRLVTVSQNRMIDLGAGGVKVGTTSIPASEADVTRSVSVQNNEVAHGGRVHPAAVGIWVGQARDVRVDWNHVYDFYYTGVSLGWTWGYGRTASSGNVVRANHIHHLGQGVLSDMAGIYTLGRSRDLRLEGNRIHDVTRDKYGGWGIYYDEGSDGVSAEYNLLYRCQDGGFHQHYGTNNAFRNNVIMDSGTVAWGPTRIDSPAEPGKPRPAKAIIFERNLVVGWGDRSVVRPEATAKLVEQNPDRLTVDDNLYWNGGPEPRFGTLSLAEWRAWGYDRNSTILDPKLPSPDAERFTIPWNRQLLPNGFRTFSVGGSGRPEEAADLDPTRWPRWFPPANDGKPRAIRDDFETTPVGQTPDFAVPHEDGPATVRVSADAAFVGKRSLKFTDAKAIKHGYDPHLVYSPVNFNAGVAVARFAMRCDGGATLMHEWRGPGYPYATGPSIQLSGDGTVKAAGGRTLLKVKQGEWLQVEIRCVLGGNHGGTYQATLTPADQPAVNFADLTCSKDFTTLHWMGFMAVGDKGSAYLDEFSLQTRW